MRINLYHIALLLALFWIIGITVAYAEGDVHLGIVPMDCTDPTTRTDGSTIGGPVSVKFYLSDSVTDLPPPETFAPVHTEVMGAGCEHRELAGNGVLQPETQYWKLAVAYDSEGRVSSYSEFVPFTFNMAPPNAPVVQ